MRMLWRNSRVPMTGSSLRAPRCRGDRRDFSRADIKTVSTGRFSLVFSPRKLAIPVPKMVRVRPVTFWLAFKLTVKKAYNAAPRAPARMPESRVITRESV